jgi:hypothetical protein
MTEALPPVPGGPNNLPANPAKTGFHGDFQPDIIDGLAGWRYYPSGENV